MQPDAASRTPKTWRFAGYLVLLSLLALAAVAHSRLAIDRSNDAMKAPGTEDAALLQRIRSEFGEDQPLVLAFLPRSSEQLTRSETDAIEACRSALLALPGVRSADAPPQVDRKGATEQGSPHKVVLLELAPDCDPELVTAEAKALCPPTLRLLASGMPLAERIIARTVAHERSDLVPQIAVALLLLLTAFYRSLHHALAVLAPSVAAIFVAGATMHALGQQLNPITVLLEPVLLTVGVATAVHIVSAFRHLRAEDLQPLPAAQRAVSSLQTPLLLTTATTILGFWSLMGNAIPAVVDFGLYAALGTALVHVGNFLLLPQLLAFDRGRRIVREPVRSTAATSSHGLVRWIIRRRYQVLVPTSLLAVLAAVLWAELKVDNDPLLVLDPDTTFVRQTRELSQHLGGVESFGLFVDSKSAALRPDRLLPFAAAAANMPPAAGFAGPPLRSSNGSLLLPILLKPSGSEDRTRLFNAIEERARLLNLGGIRPGGLSVQIARDSDMLCNSQRSSMLLVVAGLSIGLWIGLRNLRLVLLGLVPNVLPCLLLYGGLAAAGRPLTVANVMIGSVMLGLVVDNTIHFLHRFHHARGSVDNRLRHAFQHVGPPMLVSSAVLTCGFAMSANGELATTTEFALLSGTTIALALLSDGVVLPALLATFRTRRSEA